MAKPIIVINFKTYASAIGKKAEKLAKICEKIAKEKKADIRVAVQAADLYRASSKVSIPIYAEHVDAIEPGRNTGYILPEDVKEEGAIGSLLNHSEHKISTQKILKTLDVAKNTKLKFIICAATVARGEKISKLKAIKENKKVEFIAIEPSKLIGGKISVSTANPKLIKDAVSKIKKPVLVGAGVHTKEDLQIAIKLGAKGVLLASGVTKAKNPEKILREMLS